MIAQPSERSILRWDGGNSLLWQVAVAIGSWCSVVALHRGNSGLWYQGDSPTHALNGLFWWDFLSHIPVNPVRFALGYYGRYPAISPIAYPPVFYLLEALCYRIFGVSPFVAKGLVLVFALLGCFYLMAWLRRWISPAAGWGAVLFLLLPAMVLWSNAVMLNVPCTVLGLAALYHWRRWLDDVATRQIYWSAGYALLAVFTYLPTMVVVLVFFGWAVAEKKLQIFGIRRLWIVAGVCAALILPWAHLVSKWDAGYKQVSLYQGEYPYWKFASWVYYMKQIPSMLTLPVVILGLIALLLALVMKRWRREISLAVIWFVVCYAWFSVFSVKEARYVLLLVPPVIILCTLGLIEIVECFPRMSKERSAGLIVVGLLLLVTFSLRTACLVSVPRESGSQEAVSYMRQVDPNSRVFYDGDYSGLFTYYYRIEDPHFSGGVVRADKLLYTGKISIKFGLVENVSSSREVLNLVQHQIGCKYFLIQRKMNDVVPAELYLRRVLSGNEFRLVRSFRVETPQITDLDLYEYTGELAVPEEYDLRFLTVGENAVFRLTPIQSEDK
jgi:hypothetical protein